MNFNQILSAAVFAIVIQESFKYAVSIETITKYSKVSVDYNNDSDNSNSNKDKTNTGKTTTERNFNLTVLPLNDTTEVYEYDDFDDLQEERDNSYNSQQSPVVDVLKYFGGLVSLITLMNDFKGVVGEQPKHEKHARDVEDEIKNSERKINENVQAKGKQFYEAEDRFEFPQKKFRKPSPIKINSGDHQFQPLENYPPYNPLTANAAETYGNDDKKTSYDVYNSGQQDYNGGDVSYDGSKPVNQNDDGNTWDVHPVYQPWMSKPQEIDDHDSSLTNSYQWHQDDFKQGDGTYDLRQQQPWNGNPSDHYPVYQHQDLQDHHHHHHDYDHHSDDHHYDDHHPIDEVRVSKKPYSYYFLGRKLWYVPLLFSVYFIIYIGALVLKSIAKHKIQFPEKVWDLHDATFGHSQHRKHRKIDELTEKYENAIEKVKNKFM